MQFHQIKRNEINSLKRSEFNWQQQPERSNPRGNEEEATAELQNKKKVKGKKERGKRKSDYKADKMLLKGIQLLRSG